LTFSKDLAYKGRHWHERCFKCTKCSRSLVEKPFAAKDELLLCTECYSNEYSSKCFHCQKTIMPGKTTGILLSWHESCFVCQYCQQPLGTKPLITKDNENYCVPCFEKQFAHHCHSCKKEVLRHSLGGAKFVSFEECQWHEECFNCARCSVSLVGQGFLTKQDAVLCHECGSS
uniref:Four and a half LIM domains 5 n=1 Tax=Pavo cristatus TaxID=9049 RepID=A0A8C9F4E9_PAVCR